MTSVESEVLCYIVFCQNTTFEFKTKAEARNFAQLVDYCCDVFELRLVDFMKQY